VKILALDPGERVGWATATVDGPHHELVIEDHGIARLRDMAMAVYRAVVTEDKYDVVIYETWRLRANKARQFAGNDFPSVQFIGMVRLACWLNPRVKLASQGPSIKSTADKVIPNQYPDVARRIDNAPAAHDESHDTDALRHIAFYHWSKLS
jgi:hypothetical protein